MTLKRTNLMPSLKPSEWINPIGSHPQYKLTRAMPVYAIGQKTYYRSDQAANFIINMLDSPLERDIHSFLRENARRQTQDKGNAYAVGKLPSYRHAGSNYYEEQSLLAVADYLKEDQMATNVRRDKAAQSGSKAAGMKARSEQFATLMTELCSRERQECESIAAYFDEKDTRSREEQKDDEKAFLEEMDQRERDWLEALEKEFS